MKTLKNSELLSALIISTCLGPLAFSGSAQAATFSKVSTGIRFDNFSHPALSTATNAVTNTLIVSEGGSAIALSDAEAVFISGIAPGTEAAAFNLIHSQAEGRGGNYFGLAQSEASLVGDFALAAQETFSFSFNGFLSLATSIDNATDESAFSLGELSFTLFGVTESKPTTLLDSFNLFATFETPGDGDSLELLLTGTPGSWTIDNFFRQTGDTDEALVLEFSGRYSRTFEEPTLVSLVETKTGVAAVQQVPAPNLLWGLMTYGGLGMFGKLRKRLTSIYAISMRW